MQVQLEIPEDVVERFAGDPGGVTRAALEALAADGVRAVKAHGVFLQINIDDVIADSKTAT